MKKEIRQADPVKGILTVTTVDERWYACPRVDPVSGIPCGYDYRPSVTYIASFYPKGIGWAKWMASLGFNEAEATRQAAADKGSKIHQGIARMLEGEPLTMDTPLTNPSTGQLEPPTLEEWEALMSFARWYQEAKPEVVSHDGLVVSEEYDYAGSYDLICRLAGTLTLIDFKSGQDVWPAHEIQVSAYGAALGNGEPLDLAILQVGYRRNRAGWKFTSIEPQFDLFLAARQIWAKETGAKVPLQKDYPLTLDLAVPLPDVDAAPKKRGKKEAA